MGKRSVAVTIADQQYRIRGEEEDEAVLVRAAAYVDSVMSRIRERTGTVDSYDVAVLAALNLSHELLLRREQGRGGEVDEGRILALASEVEAALGSLPGGAGDAEGASPGA